MGRVKIQISMYKKSVFEDVETCKEVDNTSQEAIYKPYYFFLVWDWTSVDSVVLSGSRNQPEWPFYEPEASLREAGRRETYTVFFDDGNGKSFPYKATEGEYYTFTKEIGTVWLVTVRLGSVTEYKRPGHTKVDS